VLEVWKNDVLIQRFPDTAGAGIGCRTTSAPRVPMARQCNYSSTAPGPLDLQFRNSPTLQLNHLWPQNYITDPASGASGLTI